jgi:hypothetical protein
MGRQTTVVAAVRFDPTPLITHRFLLEEKGEAYRVVKPPPRWGAEGRHPRVERSVGEASRRAAGPTHVSDHWPVNRGPLGAWRGREVNLRTVLIVSGILLALGFALTFPPIFDLFAPPA